MRGTYNGMAATQLDGVAWQKSRHSNSQGSCVEFARLPGGDVAVRNSRFPEGPALVYTRAEIEAHAPGHQGRRVRPPDRELRRRRSRAGGDCA